MKERAGLWRIMMNYLTGEFRRVTMWSGTAIDQWYILIGKDEFLSFYHSLYCCDVMLRGDLTIILIICTKIGDVCLLVGFI